MAVGKTPNALRLGVGGNDFGDEIVLIVISRSFHNKILVMNHDGLWMEKTGDIKKTVPVPGYLGAR